MRKTFGVFSFLLIMALFFAGCSIFEISLEECGIADLTKRFESNMKNGNGMDMPYLFTEPAKIMDGEYTSAAIENNYSFIFDLRDAFSNIVASDRSKLNITLYSDNYATVSFLLTLRNNKGHIQEINYCWALYKTGEKWLITDTNVW